MTTDDPVLPIVEQFAADHGGEFQSGEQTADVDIAWSYHVEHTNGQFSLIRNKQEYESHTGKTVELPPVLIVRCVNYTDDEMVDPALMLVPEDDPNGFQKDVADLSVEYREEDAELTFLLDEFNLPDTELQRVTLRSVEDGFRVLEPVTEMG